MDFTKGMLLKTQLSGNGKSINGLYMRHIFKLVKQGA